MRILHVLDHSLPLHSGYVFRTMGILGAQRNLGWETHHLTTPKHSAPWTEPTEQIDGWAFHRTPAPTSAASRLPAVAEIAAMRATERQLDALAGQLAPDILHAHSPALNGMPAVRVGRRRRIPVVYEIRAFWEDAAVDHGTSLAWGPRYRATRALETWVAREAAAVTTICEGLRRDLIGRGIQTDKITVIPNAIDAERFTFDPQPDTDLADTFGLGGADVLGFIGSFYAYEGLDLLLEALPAIRAARPAIKLLMVGGGPRETHLKQQAEQLGLNDAVVFTGRVPQSDVERYYSVIDMLVLPRRRMRLTDLVTPLKPLESMAQGRVVVASDVGGHKELIEDGVTGFLGPPDDPQALAATVLRAFERRQTWPTLCEEARRRIEACHAWSVVVERYRGVYARARAGTEARSR